MSSIIPTIVATNPTNNPNIIKNPITVQYISANCSFIYYLFLPFFTNASIISALEASSYEIPVFFSRSTIV